MEPDPVDAGVPAARARVRGAGAQGLAGGLACSSDVRLRDRRERNELHGVDLDHTGADPVQAARLDLWALPKPDRQRDIAGQDVVAQLAAELHTPDSASGRSALLPLLLGVCGNWVATHRGCILGSCVGSAYMAGQP